MNNDNRVYAAGAAAHNRASNQFRVRPLRVALIVVAALLLLLAMPGISHATVTVSRAEVSGDRLRIEGTAAPNRTITVDGVAIGTSDGGGQFRIERTGFMAPADCTVDVNDGSATATTARLSGCTVSSPPPPSQVAVSSLTLSQTTVVGGNPVARATSADFTVTTTAVNDTQSATITATGGGASRSVTLTVVPQSAEQRGSISLARGCVGPCGGGTVTSQPAGVNCTFTPTTTSGACNNVFFPIGTQVRLEARPDANSKFQGWEFEVSCRDAPKVTIQAGVAHICRPVFSRR